MTNRRAETRLPDNRHKAKKGEQDEKGVSRRAIRRKRLFGFASARPCYEDRPCSRLYSRETLSRTPMPIMSESSEEPP